MMPGTTEQMLGQGSTVEIEASACLRFFDSLRPQVTENARVVCRFSKSVVTHFLCK